MIFSALVRSGNSSTSPSSSLPTLAFKHLNLLENSNSITLQLEGYSSVSEAYEPMRSFNLSHLIALCIRDRRLACGATRRLGRARSPNYCIYWSFRKFGVPYIGVLLIRILCPYYSGYYISPSLAELLRACKAHLVFWQSASGTLSAPGP